MFVLIECIDGEIFAYQCDDLTDAVKKMREKLFSFPNARDLIKMGNAGISEDSYGAWLSAGKNYSWRIFSLMEKEKVN